MSIEKTGQPNRLGISGNKKRGKKHGKRNTKSTSIFWRHVILNAGSVSQNLERKSCCR